SSEVRPMRHFIDLAPDPDALRELMNYRWAAGRLSNYQGIERIPGGTVLKISLSDGVVSEKRFCDPLDTLSEESSIDRQEALAIAEEALTDSVKAHLASDVGYTVQLSGGVDSSLIAALAQASSDRPIKTFSIHLPGFANDERPWRDKLLERYEFEHHEFAVGGRDFSDAFDRALLHMEGPTPHLGCVLLMLLCDRIRGSDKVVLTGEGGDEFFGGYLRYGHWRRTQWQERAARLPFARSLPPRRPFAGVRRLAGLDAAAYGGVYHDIQEVRRLFPEMIPSPGAREALGERFPDLLQRTFAVDQTAYLESLLLRQDKMAMAASVEARVPFVHLPLARRINRVPRRVLAPGAGQTKPVLKTVADHYLPQEIVHRRKVGLLLPFGEWLRDQNGLGGILDSLNGDSSKISAYVSRRGLTEAVSAFRHGMAGAEQIVMQLVNIEAWLHSIPASTGLGDSTAPAS
ncbi:MAG: asparagine synthase C-terminal domain-containing protein, partial [Alphaproteobacteria bacterium]